MLEEELGEKFERQRGGLKLDTGSVLEETAAGGKGFQDEVKR